MKAAIVIDDWKLSIFEHHLLQAGYSYVENPGITKDTITLTVVTDDVQKLGDIVKVANREAAIISNIKTETIQ